jgi:hypothetical protein
MPFRYLTMIACVALATLAMPAAPAKADCVDDCQAATYCDSTMHASGECSEKLNQCYQLQCNKPQHAFGAIAYGAEQPGLSAMPTTQPDGDSASAVALKNCQKHGPGCEVVYGFTDACAALAAGNTERYGIGEGASRERAEKERHDLLHPDQQRELRSAGLELREALGAPGAIPPRYQRIASVPASTPSAWPEMRRPASEIR